MSPVLNKVFYFMCSLDLYIYIYFTWSAIYIYTLLDPRAHSVSLRPPPAEGGEGATARTAGVTDVGT